MSDSYAKQAILTLDDFEGTAEAIRKLVSLFDKQGNMTADFNSLQVAVLGGYDILSQFCHVGQPILTHEK